VLGGDTLPSHAELVRQVLQYHLEADVDSPVEVQKQVTSVLTGPPTGKYRPQENPG
jgi:hypothetical protein